MAVGHLGYAWQAPAELADRRRRASASPTVFLVIDASGVDGALGRLRLGLVAAGLIAVSSPWPRPG
jgi:hypothetical protein